jgi:hypothetical protein
MTTSVDVTNRALAQIGSRSQISSMTDGSTEALYANLLYVPLRNFLLYEGDYDWSMLQIPLVAMAGGPPPAWLFAYQYPNIIRVRQVIPADYNPLDPHPVEWNVMATSLVPGVRQIVTRVAASSILATVEVLEDFWDSIFTEAYTRLLGSALAFALENRIEASKEKLSEALSFAGIANMRDS